MFQNKSFYHKHVKKAIIAFGTIFNSINLQREDDAGNIAQVIRVPLSYSTKQKFLSRIRSVPDAEARGEVQISLPRMGFDILSLSYDSARKISPIQQNKAVGLGDDAQTVRTTFTSTPYNMTMGLYIFAKNQEDALQIVEQIIPFFNPDFNITVNELPQLGITRDIKITLDSVDYQDEYEGAYESRQSIIWTLTFTMRLNFYGYVANQKIIKESIAKLYTDDLFSTVQVKETATLGKNGVTDSTITPADEYDYITSILEAFEGEDVS